MSLDVGTAQPWLELTCDEQVGACRAAHHLSLYKPWTVLFGPSGAGKSTLLRLLAGLEPQHTGHFLLNSGDLRTTPAWKRRIVMVEQAPALFPHLTVEQNIAFGCRSNPGCDDYLRELTTAFHLDDLRKAKPNGISGGERQRVAIARALGATPKLLLLDEVFSGMDAPLRTALIESLRLYSARLHMPILSVTHDVGEVFATADEVLRMQAGRIVAQGPPSEVLAAERSQLVASLST